MNRNAVEEYPIPRDRGRNTEAGEDTPLLGDMDEIGRGVSTDILVAERGKKFPQYCAAVCATLGAFALGTSLGWSSPIQSTPDSYIEKLLSDLTEEQKIEAWSWIAGLMPLGAATVSFLIGYMISRFGRKYSMLALVVPFTIGWVLIIVPKNLAMVCVGRFLLGMAGGAFAVAAPVYTSEIAEKEIRGAVGSYFQLMITSGILFVYVVGAYVNPVTLSIICGVVPIVFVATFVFMPETPEYLLSQNKYSEAKKSLQFFRGKDYNVEHELREMQQNMERLQANRVSLLESFSTAAVKKSLLISLGLMFVQQLSGVNAVIFNTVDIFKAAGNSSGGSIPTIIVGLVQCVSTFFSTLVVDRLGRKILLIISASTMCICTMLLGVFFYLKEHEKDVSSINWLPLTSLCFFMISFSIGFGPIPWMILGELFHPSVKGTASSIACCFNWVLAFLVTKFYAPISQKEGTGVTFFIFMSILALGTAFVLYCVKETKGKTSEEIQKELEN